MRNVDISDRNSVIWREIFSEYARPS